MKYDDSYAAAPALFGVAPEPLLVKHWEALDPSLPVLDLGAGQGRHTLFLARQGIHVTALDPSAVAVDTVREAARAEDLPVESIQGSFESFESLTDQTRTFGGILIFGLIQILTWEGIRALQRFVHHRTSPGALVFITAFSSEDKRYDHLRKTLKRIGPRSFMTAEGEPRTYLEPGEILSLFPEYSPVHHWEGVGPEHRHGDYPPERHHMIEAVLRR